MIRNQPSPIIPSSDPKPFKTADGTQGGESRPAENRFKRIHLFGTPEYWREVADGRISESQAEQDERDLEECRPLAEQAQRRAADGRKNQLTGLRKAIYSARRKGSPARIQPSWKCLLPSHVIRDGRLTNADKRILNALLELRGGKDRYIETSGAGLAVLVDVSREYIRRRLIKLQEFGYIASRVLKMIYRAGRTWFAGQVIELASLTFPGGRLPDLTDDDLTARERISVYVKRLRALVTVMVADTSNWSRVLNISQQKSREFSPWRFRERLDDVPF